MNWAVVRQIERDSGQQLAGSPGPDVLAAHEGEHCVRQSCFQDFRKTRAECRWNGGTRSYVDTNPAEDRRLFYVALTRARRQAVLCYFATFEPAALSMRTQGSCCRCLVSSSLRRVSSFSSRQSLRGGVVPF